MPWDAFHEFIIVMENEDVEDEVGVIGVRDSCNFTVSFRSFLLFMLGTRNLAVTSEAVVLGIHQE